MTLRRHEGKRLVVGVDDHDARGEAHSARRGQVEYGYFAGGNPGQRSIKTVPGRPVLGKVLLPGLDDLSRGHHRAAEADTVCFLPHWTKAPQRSSELTAFHVEVNCLRRDIRHLQ